MDCHPVSSGNWPGNLKIIWERSNWIKKNNVICVVFTSSLQCKQSPCQQMSNFTFNLV